MNRLSIKALRKQAGRTQSEMADLCGVSANTYRSWEHNPDAMPHGLWMDVVFHLEMAAQIKRKADKMAEHLGEVHVKVDWDPEDEPFTVPVPEGLTDNFVPSKPVTPKQAIDFLTDGKEPYEGYADEYEEWEKQWEAVRRAQHEAEGTHDYVSDTVMADPEFDEETGEPVIYDEPQLVIDRESGEATVKVDRAEAEADEEEEA